ncbi:serine/threonine-protein kinase [Micromonospora sp. HUAS LYJ1]|uniref:serine/threonine-protein kinase n=1 Tax=Micromonospora sp. HUAS LYJ1 TaxID=3061626 RepID=UPI00267239B4|nr:serine/threonine-protein kinase [Micromonospora sp. HUAS LYJ1]WKU07290.1 protein kinase [Micromonospora sp. HUAS LYJ1]
MAKLSAVLTAKRLRNRYVLGRYPLPGSGMGEVWVARDTRLERDVIVKFVQPAQLDVELIRRFRREALLTARLDHPGVPAVYDLDEHDGRPYVVLEKIDGITLSTLVDEQHPVPIGWVAAIGAQISSVLIAAQQIGLVHRDIKPSNIMLDPRGAVKVLDFGLAVMRDDDRYSRITETGQSLGTVGYMAPEQILGEPVDHRTDLYGLGGTLFHLLTAQVPFDGDTTTTTLRHQLDDPPPRAAELRPEIPAVLGDLVDSLLAHRREDRPADASEVYAALASLALDRPALPGVVTDSVGAVQGYAAVVGGTPQPAHRAVSPVPPSVLDPEQVARQAEQLFAAGEFRAAARLWRSLVEHHVQRHGDNHPAVFGFRLNTARAHDLLGEHGRALRQLNDLLHDQTRLVGAGHPSVQQLRQEIEALEEKSASSPRPRSVPSAGR